MPTCPTTAILPAHICAMCQEHTGTFQVPQRGGQVQGSPTTGIQLFNVHLWKKRWSPGHFGGSDMGLTTAKLAAGLWLSPVLTHKAMTETSMMSVAL